MVKTVYVLKNWLSGIVRLRHRQRNSTRGVLLGGIRLVKDLKKGLNSLVLIFAFCVNGDGSEFPSSKTTVKCTPEIAERACVRFALRRAWATASAKETDRLLCA